MIKSVRFQFLATFLFFSLVGSGVGAENGQGPSLEENTSQGEPYELKPIVVRSSRIRQTEEDPSSFATVLETQQFASQFRPTEDLLSRTPGITIKKYGGLGQFSTVSIRGSSSEQVLVLLDGIRLNTGQGGSVALGGVDFSSIPLDSIERIEITRGGGTTMYGSDAIGGVVNIITKKPTERPELSTSVTYGSQDTVKASLTGRGKKAGISYLIGFTHFRSDGDFDYQTPEIRNQGKIILASEERTRINNAFFSDNLLTKGECSITKGLTLTVDNEFFYTDRGQPGTVFDIRENAWQHLLRNLTNARLEKKEFILPEADFRLTLFNLYDRSHFVDPTPSLNRPPIDTTRRDYSFGLQPEASLPWKRWGIEHVVSFLGEVSHEELHMDIPPWQTGVSSADRTSYNWHLQDEMVLLGGGLSLTPAVRYEESTDFGHYWTGKIGAIAKPLAWVHIKSNFENSFRKPNFSELYYPDEGWIRGNPDLKPEKARNFDLGAGLDFPRFFFETAYFRNWIDESILWLPVSFYTIAPLNTGHVDSWGVEVDTEYRPWDPLFLSANYTYLHAVSKDTGQQLQGRPRHTVNFKTSLQGRYGEVYTEMQYLSDIPLQITNTARLAVTGRSIVDLGVTANVLSISPIERLHWFRKCTVSLEVKNVGDASVYDAQYFPLPGRMFFFTLYALF
jgi:iron complex outermembrane receptor protein